MKVGFVTGGNKGIGLGIVEKLLEDGVNVAFTGRNTSDNEKTQVYLEKKYPGMTYAVEADVRSLDQMKSAISNTIEKWGRIDYLIANAGVGHFKNIMDLSPEEWQETIDINLTGVFNTLKPAIEALTQTEGYFITIASLAGTNFFINGSAYNASKFGLVGFTQAVMLDLRDKGIKVSTIMPGSVTSYFNGHIPSDQDAWKIQPEDIGQIVVDLVHMPARTLPSKIEVRPSRTK
jgi:NAD(P)-dependent dehydrogenase (short-subunit alcohol dehydrogenase family)